MKIERWFQAEVVDVDDPLKMGRIKVKELVGQDKDAPADLFWCHVVMPPTGANAKGVGVSAVGINENSKVFGFRVNSKISYIIGSFPYAVDDNNHSLSKQARGVGPVQKEYITEFGEKKSEYAAKYPHNKTITSESGHVLELDDTPKAERIHVYHKSGSYIEIFPDGSIVTKSMKDSTSVTIDDHSISVIKGDLQIVANEGKIQINSDGDIDIVSKSGVVNIQGTDIGLKGKIYLDGDVELTGKLTTDKDILSNNISLQKHRHSLTGSPPIK
jgi:hypothetical protein